MELLVDFNCIDKAGQIPALIPPGRIHDLASGTQVVLTDEMGTRCLAVVDRIGANGLYVFVVPEPDSFSRDSSEGEFPLPLDGSPSLRSADDLRQEAQRRNSRATSLGESPNANGPGLSAGPVRWLWF